MRRPGGCQCVGRAAGRRRQWIRGRATWAATPATCRCRPVGRAMGSDRLDPGRPSTRRAGCSVTARNPPSERGYRITPSRRPQSGVGEPDQDRAPSGRTGARRADQPPDRRATVHLAPDGGNPPRTCVPDAVCFGPGTSGCRGDAPSELTACRSSRPPSRSRIDRKDRDLAGSMTPDAGDRYLTAARPSAVG